MKILDGKTIAEFLDRYVDKEKQAGAFSFDLTAKSITQLEGAGKIDFSGREFEWGQRSIISPKRFTPGESLGWWKLTPGEYVVRFNESLNLPEDTVGVILVHERMSLNGAQHPPVLVQSTANHLEILLVVGRQGIEIKENARISYLMLFQA